jgi:glycosyltransferase
MKVSIITVVRNNKRFIAQAIESVLNQDYPDIEYIVIDGESTDGTSELIEKYSDHLGLYIREKDDGIYNAMNKGLRVATGDVVAYVHSDDFMRKASVIDSVVKIFDVNPSLNGIYGDLEYVDRNAPNKRSRLWISSQGNLDMLRNGWMLPHPTLYLKKTAYDSLGGYREDFKIAADYDLIIRAFQASLRIEYQEGLVYTMRCGGISTGGFRNQMLKLQEDLKVINRNELLGFWTLITKRVRKIPQLYFTAK